MWWWKLKFIKRILEFTSQFRAVAACSEARSLASSWVIQQEEIWSSPRGTHGYKGQPDSKVNVDSCSASLRLFGWVWAFSMMPRERSTMSTRFIANGIKMQTLASPLRSSHTPHTLCMPQSLPWTINTFTIMWFPAPIHYYPSTRFSFVFLQQ